MTHDGRRTTTPRRILIARLDRLGDVVLSTPVIRHMRKLFPGAYIAFMVRPENREVVENNPDLNEVIVYDKNGKEKSLFGAAKFAAGTLRKKRFDTAIALHPTNRTHIAFFLAGIPNRIGYARKMGGLLTKKVSHLKHQGILHEADYNFELLRRAGFSISGYDRRPYMFTDQKDKRGVDRLMDSMGIGKRVIAVHAGASCRSKRWSPGRFAETADILGERYGMDVVIVGGKESEPESRVTAASMRRRVFDLTGKLRIGELAEILSRSKLFISNDSGPVHVAVAMGTPVISIFGRKDPGLSPKRWGPLGTRDAVLHKDVGCVKCLAHNCGIGFKCLDAVTVGDVVKAAEKILG